MINHTCLFTFILDQKPSKEKALKTARLIAKALLAKSGVKISEYPKFENSYKVECSVDIPEGQTSAMVAITLASKICTPWLVWYDDQNNSLEMIFNRDVHTRFRNEAFNTIMWAELILDQKKE